MAAPPGEHRTEATGRMETEATHATYPEEPRRGSGPQQPRTGGGTPDPHTTASKRGGGRRQESEEEEEGGKELEVQEDLERRSETPKM